MPLIRQIRSTDWQRYKALRTEALCLHPEAFATDDDELGESDEAWRRRVAAYAQSIDHTVLVADNQCQLVGMIGLQRQPEKFNHVALIWGMYVQADYRGQHLGSALVHETIALARHIGVKKIRLAVNAINEPAHKLYRACGFTETGRFYQEMNIGGQLCDVILMEIFL